jgi:hypothetical protein
MKVHAPRLVNQSIMQIFVEKSEELSIKIDKISITSDKTECFLKFF